TRLSSILNTMDTITVTKLRKPLLRDRLAVRHGRYIINDIDDHKTIRFIRDELGILVDFMAELYKSDGHKLIGMRGMPRVGKTESIVAASVCANKRWLFLSSTLLKQTVRSQLISGEYNEDNIYIIDGIVSRKRMQAERHWQLIREVMQLPTIKVVEHPDIFVQATEYKLEDFDYMIELRKDENEEITYEVLENQHLQDGFPSMDFQKGWCEYMELGAIVKEARQEKNISLESLQESTKIEKRYLKAIEQGNFHILPGTFYARAFIKEYAEAVGLNAEELLAEHKNELPTSQPKEDVQY